MFNLAIVNLKKLQGIANMFNLTIVKDVECLLERQFS